MEKTGHLGPRKGFVEEVTLDLVLIEGKTGFVYSEIYPRTEEYLQWASKQGACQG